MTRKADVPGDRVTITVRPSAAHPDILSVQDAMRQVLDFFDLLTPDEQESSLVWNLRMASTNSPLTVVGEPASLLTDVDVSVIARAQRSAIAEQFRTLASGGRPTRRLSKKKRDTVRRIFNRNMKGIGRTDAILDLPDAPVLITPTIAQTSIAALESEYAEFDALVLDDRGREEIGSIEGYLLEVGTEYNQPAILVRERRTSSDIWCRIDANLKHSISEDTRFEDVWDRRRVIIKGRIRYDKDGAITRVHATSVSAITPRQMLVHDIKDSNFTGGLSAASYLEKFREGELE